MSLATFLERIRRARSGTALFAVLEEEAGRTGLRYLAYAALKDHSRYGAPKHPAPIVMHSCPEEWIADYLRDGYARSDPVLLHAPEIRVPFLWRWLPELRPLDEAQIRVLAMARAAGLKEGMSVPLIGPASARAVLSFATSDETAEIEPLMGRLALYAAIFHVALVELTGVVADIEPDEPLTPMERACLGWVAEGKTSWEIAVILGISEATARAYLRRARRKLRATTQAMAVARAMHLGLLEG